jgi:TP901 family phage tail tape measure protein
VSEFASFEENVARSLDLAAKHQRDFAGQNRDLFIQVQKQLRQVARETIFTAEEVANTFNLLVRGGLELEEALASIKPTVDLAIATRGTPEDAAQLINVLRNQFGLVRDGARQATFTVEEYNKAVGDLADTLVFATKSAPVDIKGFRVALEQTGEVAAQVGLTLEETTSLLIRLFEGLPAPSKVGTGLSRAIVRALKPTEAGLKRIDAALQGTGKNLEDFFEGQKFKPGGFVELIEALQKAGVGIGGLVDIFGFRTRAVARLFAEFEGGTNTFAKYTRELKKAQRENLAQAIADDIAQNTLFGSLKLLRSEFAELKTSIFNNLINLGLVDFIRRIRDGVRAVSVFVANFKTFEDAIAGVIKAFKNIGDAAVRALKPIGNFLLVFNAAVLAAGLGLAEAAFKRLEDAIGGVVQILDVAGFEVLGVKNAFSNIHGAIEAATVLLVNYREVFKAAVLTGYIAVLKATIAIRDFLKEKGFFGSIFSALESTFTTLLALLKVGGRVLGASIGRGIGDSIRAELASIPLVGGFIDRFLEAPDERIARLNAKLAVARDEANLAKNEIKQLNRELENLGKTRPETSATFFGFLADVKNTAIQGLSKIDINSQISFQQKRLKQINNIIAKDSKKLAKADPAGAIANKAIGDLKRILAEFGQQDFFQKIAGLDLTEQLEQSLELLKKFPDELKPLNKEQRKQLDTLRKRLKEALRIQRTFEDALKGEGGDTNIRFLGLEEFGRLINTAFDPTVDPTKSAIDDGNTILTSINTGIQLLNDTMNDIRSRGGFPARALRAGERAAPYAQPLIPTVLSYLFPHTIT